VSGDVRLPVLEAPRGRLNLVPIARHPLSGMEVEQRRLQLLDHGAPNVQEARAARPSEELAPGAGQHVAADGVNVERQLSGGLTGVEQVRHARLARQAPHFLGRIHQPAVGRHVCEADETHTTPGQRLAHRVDRHLAVLVVGDDLDDRPGLPGHLKIGDEVAGVFGG